MEQNKQTASKICFLTVQRMLVMASTSQQQRSSFMMLLTVAQEDALALEFYL